MRSGRPIDSRNVSVNIAMEMADVGIVPTLVLDPVGHKFTMGGQTFVSGAEATFAEFIEAVNRSSLSLDAKLQMCAVPTQYKFQRIYTD